MRLVLSPDALKALAKLPMKRRQAIMRRLSTIAADPFGHHAGVKSLAGVNGGFRLRVGDWRVLYVVDPAAQSVRVYRVGPRGRVYKQ